MPKNIEQHLAKVSEAMQFIQMHFYEHCLIAGRPLLKPEARKKMFQTHLVGLQHFSPNPQLREDCNKFPCLGAIIDRPFYNKIYNANEKGIYFVPWGVRIVRPEENRDHLKESGLKALLYCPAEFEISEEIDWFEKEDSAGTLTNQLLTVGSYLHQQELLRKNLLQDPFPLWESSKEEWLNDPDNDSDPDKFDIVPKQPKNLDTADFAPKKRMSLALAYEAVMASIRERQYRHRHYLRTRYKNKLEKAIFQNLDWKEAQQQEFLRTWEQFFF